MSDSPGESTRITHHLHGHEHVAFEFSEDSVPDSWWINMQLLYPDDSGEHLAEVGMTDVEAIDLVEDLLGMVVRGRVEFNVEAAVQERYEEELEAARHDMPAELYNEIASALMDSPNPEALFIVERLRSRYGASTRRNYGLDQITEPERSQVRDVKAYRDPNFWRDEHDESL